MTDSELAPRSPLCFLSTLPSQKVPEQSDLVLRCTISGQPKPDVTWYKNGHAISESNIISNYEILENQYIHMLHLYSCTKNDAAVYQISAQNCFGMICCSAFIEVECFSENPQLNPNLSEDAARGWKNKTGMCKKDNSHQMKEQLFQKKGNVTEDTSTLSASFPKFRHSCLSQLQSNNDNESHSPEKDTGVKSTIQTQENCSHHNYTDEHAFNEADRLDKYRSGLVHSKPSRLIDDFVASYGHNDEVLPLSYQNSKIQKYISFSMALPEETTSIYPVNSSTTKQNVSPEISSEDSDTDFELCPEINLTCTEEFSDDDLEYLECSDVMTDYSNSIWQEDLRGNDPLFLLERDDEEAKFREDCLGGYEHFHSEMACQSQVSDNIMPMDTTVGLCGHHSKLQGPGRSSLPIYNQSTLQPGMTLILGHPQDETSPVKEQELPVSSTANDSDQPGMKGENADSHQAGEYLAIDSLMNMDKTPGEMMPQTHELEKPVTDQPVENSAEKCVEGDLRQKKGSQKLVRVRRPGTKGKPKKLSTNLKGNATDSTLKLPGPGEVRDLELRQGDTRENFHEEAEAIHLNSQFHGEYAFSTQAQQEIEALPTPTESLPTEGETELKKKGKCTKGLLETDQVLSQHAHPQVQREEISAEGITKSHLQGFSEPMRDSESLWKTPAFSRTIISSGDTLQSISEGDGSLTCHMQQEGCSLGPQHYERGDQESNIQQTGSPRKNKSCEQISSEASHENALDCELLAHYQRVSDADLGEQESLYITLAEASYAVLTAAHSLSAPRDAEEPHETGDPEKGCGPKDLPYPMLYEDCLPQENCSMGSELAEGQCETSDVCLLRDVMMERFSGAQDADPPSPMCENREAGGANTKLYPMGISTGNSWEGAYENDTNEKKIDDKNSVKEFTRILKTDQERLSPSNLISTQIVSTENNCLSQLQETGGERLLLGTEDETETPSCCSIIAEYPEQKSSEMSTENIRGSQVPSDGEETPTPGTVVKGHQVKYLAVSIAQNNHLEGAEESLPGAPAGSIAQLPSNEQPAPAGSDWAANAAEQLTLKDRLGTAAHLPHSQLLQREDSLRNSLGAIAYELTSENQGPESTVDESWEGHRQGKVREPEQNVHREIQPHQGSFTEDSLQDVFHTIPAAQEQRRLLPLEHASNNSEEEGWNLGGPCIRVLMVSDEGERQASQKVPPSLENLLEEANKNAVEGSQRDCESGGGQKVPTLTALVSEPSPPIQTVDLECKVSPAVLGNICVISEKLGANNSVQKLDTYEGDTSASLLNQSDSTSVCSDTEIQEKKEVKNNVGFCIPSLQYLKDSSILESSVDPVDGKETCTADSLFKGTLGVALEVSGKKNTGHVGKAQEEGQSTEVHPVLLTQFLTHPQIMESSVDSTDGAGVMEYVGTGKLVTSESTPGVVPEERNLNKKSFSQKLKIKPALLQVPCHKKVGNLGKGIPCVGNDRQSQEGMKSDLGEPGHKTQDSTTECKDMLKESLVLSNSLVGLATDTSSERDTNRDISQTQDVPVNGLAELKHREWICTDSQGYENTENEYAPYLAPTSLPSSVPVRLTLTSFLKGEATCFAKDGNIKKPTTGEPKATNFLGSPIETLAFIPAECTSNTSPKCQNQVQPNHCLKGSLPGTVQKAREEIKHCHIMPPKSKVPETLASAAEEGNTKQEMSGTGHLAEGVKKKILSKVAALKMRLEEKERARKNSIFSKKIPKPETLAQNEEKIDPKTSSWKREGKAPVLLKKIQAEIFPDHSGNIKLSCQFAEIHEDSTILWTKDSKLIARVQRSAGDNSTVSLAIVQPSQKDQGLYYCCLRNSYGKVTAEFHLTSEVLGQLSSHQDIKEFEEIEFSQLFFREDFISDSYFGGNLRGQIATEELHFGEGVHRKAFRSKVMQGLTPVFNPGHACVLKVHNAIAYGTKNNDELVQKNYKLAAQECYVQNTARQYAKIYAAEAQPLEGFGEVPEIIPIFLIHRPKNNIPYATVEEELVGEFVKYSIRDGKEINFLRRESEAGQKCCTFQHWVYQKTSGSLLVTDMQGVGMKLTDVGIATLAKGYKGFKGNCSMTFIDQFKALHQCNKYCEMLGLKSLQTNNQKQRKPVISKSKVQPPTTPAKKAGANAPAEKKIDSRVKSPASRE
ncbi:LOW QUALITY PROTEIN: alpha-protein kinase 2-like [Petaurus breviceps papuanus]|uniref:LOW QUALITY PROTEIN: alpha-protein kinase 2-like n=1 Tax=Petaurus breviceps papuanus TaxID=3040969 RepID=UPI0036D89A1B